MYSVEIKDQVIAEIKNGNTVSQISEKFNISKATIYNWKKQITNVNDDKQEQMPKSSDSVKYAQSLQLSKNIDFQEKINDECKIIESENVDKKLKKIKYLIQNDDLEKALKLSENIELINNCKAQSQRIKILIKLHQFEEALKICEREEFIDNAIIQSQRVTALIQLSRLEEALQVCKMKYICNHPLIIDQKKVVVKKLKNKAKNEQIKPAIHILAKTLTKIYCGNIELNEIDLLKVDEFDKVLLFIAYYNKNNKKKGVDFIKEKKKSYENDKSKLKILNILYDKLANKKITIFDVSIYEKYLQCNINFSLIEGIKKEKLDINKSQTKVVDNQTEKITVNEVISKEKNLKQSRMIVFEGKKFSTRQSINNNSEKIITENKKEMLIKDIFDEEILEIGKYLYARMGNLDLQKKAIDAWDRLEYLANQPISDKDKLQKMIDLIHRLEKIDDLKLYVDEKRYSKYL